MKTLIAILVPLIGAAAAVVLLFPSVFPLDTRYAPGYTERAFRSLKIGDTKERVFSMIGAAFSTNDCEPYVQWVYSADKQSYFSKDGEASGTYTTVTFKKGSLENIFGHRKTSATSGIFGEDAGYLKLTRQEIENLKGSSQDLIRDKLGPPLAIYEYRASRTLHYSRSPSGSNYRQRIVGLDDEGKVVHFWRSIYWD